MARILIADDHRANREALELARSHRPELVITDVLMPIMDGYELTRRLKLEPATAGISVMFYTAYFGGARVLVKPSDNAAIVRAVGEVLSARPAAPTDTRADLDREHLRLMVDQLLEKTGALEAQQQRIERMNRTLAMLSAINALIVRADDRQALLEEACRIAIDKGGFRLAAVGLSDSNRRLDSVLEAVSEFGGRAPLIDVEITESVLMDDIEESTRKLQTLRRAGIEVSVDDFGTGYCSLSYLARLPVDTLKIDRSFVVRMRDAGYPRNIVAMIVSLAHTLGLKVIAEGVEDTEQVHLLKELGCDQIQGYYVSAPVPAPQIEELVRSEASKSLRLRIAAA